MIALALFGMVAGCAKAPPGGGINDPFEAQNRAVHETNVEVDRLLLRPASKAYTVIPKPLQQGVANFADNFDTPGMMVNSLLQGDVRNLVSHGFRFVLNTTIGLGGVIDVADGIGVTAKDTDFGQTLHVWGAREGAYLELPFYGPSTERDAAGIVVDFALNPLGYLLTRPQSTAGTVTKLAKRVGSRARYSDTLDQLLYESADGYAQARQFYLENRRFELGQETDVNQIDPYEDPYAQ